MSKVIFLFFALFFLLLSFTPVSQGLTFISENDICVLLILALGIPHGAIDNVLFLSRSGVGKIRFYTVYIGIILINAIIWVLLPKISLLFFLLLSSYHFGQSQFVHYIKKQDLIAKGAYMSWGVCIISGLLLLNFNNLEILTEMTSAFQYLTNPIYQRMLELSFGSSLFFLLITMIILLKQNRISLEKVFLESIILMVILLSFKIFSPLVGFTLYFVILHSIKVLEEEFTYLKSENLVRNILNFIQLLLPFSLLSIFGIFFIFALIYFQFIPFTYGFAFLIVISSITMPHAVVMQRFYGA